MPTMRQRRTTGTTAEREQAARELEREAADLSLRALALARALAPLARGDALGALRELRGHNFGAVPPLRLGGR